MQSTFFPSKCLIGPLLILLISLELYPIFDGSFADCILVLYQFWWPVLQLPNKELLFCGPRVLSSQVAFFLWSPWKLQFKQRVFIQVERILQPLEWYLWLKLQSIHLPLHKVTPLLPITSILSCIHSKLCFTHRFFRIFMAFSLIILEHALLTQFQNVRIGGI